MPAGFTTIEDEYTKLLCSIQQRGTLPLLEHLPQQPWTTPDLAADIAKAKLLRTDHDPERVHFTRT